METKQWVKLVKCVGPVLMLVLSIALVGACARSAPAPSPAPKPAPTTAPAPAPKPAPATAPAPKPAPKPAPATTAAPAPKPAPSFTLKFGHTLGPAVAQSEITRRWAAELEKRTNGRIKINITFSEGLGKATEMLKLVGDGVVDNGYIMGGNFPGEMPLTTILAMPMIAYANDTVVRTHHELYKTYPPYKQEWDRNKVVPIGNPGMSAAWGHSKMPIRNVDDFKGRKVRTFGLMSSAVQKVGGTPLFIGIGELYEALQRGVVDVSSANPFEFLYSSKIYEVTPYIFDWGVGQYSNNALVMSKGLWDKLPKDLQQIVEQLRDDFVDQAIGVIGEKDAVALTAFKADPKVTVVRWAPADIAKARAMIVPAVWNEFMADIEKKHPGLPVKEFWEKAQALIAKYEKVSKYADPLKAK